MELSFKDLQKREVINVPDGKSFGNIVDLTLSFPKGILIGITVPAKKSIFNVFGFYEKLFIEDYKIKKIGTDVILVDLKAPPPRPPKKPDCCHDGVPINPPYDAPMPRNEIDDDYE